MKTFQFSLQLTVMLLLMTALPNALYAQAYDDKTRHPSDLQAQHINDDGSTGASSIGDNLSQATLRPPQDSTEDRMSTSDMSAAASNAQNTPHDTLPQDLDNLTGHEAEALSGALTRLDDMAARVTDKADKTRERIEHSELPAEEKAKLLERVRKTEQVALGRLERVKNRLAELSTAEPQESPEQTTGRQLAQSEQRQSQVMSLIQKKQETLENTTLVSGEGGKPLADQLPESVESR